MGMNLPLIDMIVIVAYIAGTVLFGCWFVRRSRTADGFTRAGGRIPMVVVGLSIFGAFVSSISFLAMPGKAFSANWNPYVMSFTLPIATFIAARWFVPFYRNGGIVSTYCHLEERFGTWARVYATCCFMITQVARMGAVMFLMALPLNLLLGWNIVHIILITGVLTTFYAMLGGIEGVIWTDALQSLILILGTFVCAAVLLFGMPEGPTQLFKIAGEHNKFSLGDFGVSLDHLGNLCMSLGEPTFWVVLIYGLTINLQNFGVDQNFVQRYLTAKSESDARRSIWLNAWLYLVVSAVFFFIGTGLFAFYTARPELLPEAFRETPDQVYPYFIIHQLPRGMTGLLIAAIFSAAMSTISSSLNGCATLTLTDFYKRFWRPNATPREEMAVLYGATIFWGAAGMTGAILLMNARQILDAWWALQGILSGGMLGLFLLGFFSRRAKNGPAFIGAVAGLCIIVWMTLSLKKLNVLPASLEEIRSPFHEFLIPVFGTTTIFLVGFLLSMLFCGKKQTETPRSE